MKSATQRSLSFEPRKSGLEALEPRHTMAGDLAGDVAQAAESATITTDSVDAVFASTREVAVTALQLRVPDGNPDLWFSRPLLPLRHDYSIFHSDRVELANGKSFRPTSAQQGTLVLPDGSTRSLTGFELIRDPNKFYCDDNGCISTLIGYSPPPDKSFLGSFTFNSSRYYLYGIVAPSAADQFDVNGDLMVTQADFETVLLSIGDKPDGIDFEMDSLLARCDINQDGFITALDALLVANHFNDANSSAVVRIPEPATDHQPLGSKLFSLEQAEAILYSLSSSGEVAIGGPLDASKAQLCKLDLNRDGQLTLLDALSVLNEIRTRNLVSQDTDWPVYFENHAVSGATEQGPLSGGQ